MLYYIQLSPSTPSGCFPCTLQLRVLCVPAKNEKRRNVSRGNQETHLIHHLSNLYIAVKLFCRKVVEMDALTVVCVTALSATYSTALWTAVSVRATLV